MAFSKFESFSILFTLLFLSFVNPIISQTNQSQSKKADCIKSYVGKIQICLPKIPGMVECYNHEQIKYIVDEFKQDRNTIHGYYLSDSIYGIVNKIENFAVSDVIKVYTVNETHNLVITENYLDKIFELLTKDYLKIILDSASLDFSRKFDQILISKPALLTVYQPQKNIKTAITLTKVNIANKQSLSLMTMTLAVIKNRLLFYSYYLNYYGEQSIKDVKLKNDNYGLRLIELNQ